jgi:hypothetical protein
VGGSNEGDKGMKVVKGNKKTDQELKYERYNSPLNFNEPFHLAINISEVM